MERMFQILMAPEGMEGAAGGGAGGEGGGVPDGEIPGDGDKKAQRTFAEGGSQGGNSQSVPYARFQEVNQKYRDLEGKYSQVEAMLNQMRGALSPEQQKKGFKLDYHNIEKSIDDHFNSMLEERFKAMEQKGSEREKQMAQAAAIKWFKDQPDYTPEMEEMAAQFIKENGLQGMDPEKAIKLAHKFVTLGDGSGYVRQQKEGVKKPGAGGKGKEQDIQSELAAIDPKDPDYEKKMKAIHAKLIGG